MVLLLNRSKDYKKQLTYIIQKNNRVKKYSLFIETFSPNEFTSILDIGYTNNEYRDTMNYFEKNYPYQSQITALGIEETMDFQRRYPEVKVIKYDGSIFPFDENEFDICWSNAVLEHVGNWQKQVLFLKEIFRTTKNAFITTPNRYFPIEIHTRTPLLHFMPKKIFDRYLKFIGKERQAGDYMNLLSYSQLVQLLDEAKITRYKIYKNRFLGFTLDFVITWCKNGDYT